MASAWRWSTQQEQLHSCSEVEIHCWSFLDSSNLLAWEGKAVLSSCYWCSNYNLGLFTQACLCAFSMKDPDRTTLYTTAEISYFFRSTEVCKVCLCRYLGYCYMMKPGEGSRLLWDGDRIVNPTWICSFKFSTINFNSCIQIKGWCLKWNTGKWRSVIMLNTILMP